MQKVHNLIFEMKNTVARKVRIFLRTRLGSSHEDLKQFSVHMVQLYLDVGSPEYVTEVSVILKFFTKSISCD